MPLVLPPGQEVGCIVGIDPGTNFLGFCALDINLRDVSVVQHFACSFQSDKMLDPDSFVSICHNERIAKIFAQKNNLLKRLRYHRPFVVTCENPFINRFRPNAYGPLVEVLFAIRCAVTEYNPAVKFLTYEPSIVKKTVGAGAICGKDEIKLVVRKIQELREHSTVNMDEMDEHAVDATAVAYTHLLKYRKEP